MSVGLGTQIALSAALGLGLIFAGCGSSAAPEDSSTSSRPTIPVIGNYPAAAGTGSVASASSGSGFKGWRGDAAGSSGAAGQATAAGSGGAAGSAGRAAAGSSASAGSSAAGTSGADAGSGATSMDDPLDLFGGAAPAAAPSCDGLVCVEDKDCQDLYPMESAACKLTKCVDFACSK